MEHDPTDMVTDEIQLIIIQQYLSSPYNVLQLYTVYQRHVITGIMVIDRINLYC